MPKVFTTTTVREWGYRSHREKYNQGPTLAFVNVLDENGYHISTNEFPHTNWKGVHSMRALLLCKVRDVTAPVELLVDIPFDDWDGAMPLEAFRELLRSSETGDGT
jgi:hypothetical protein